MVLYLQIRYFLLFSMKIVFRIFLLIKHRQALEKYFHCQALGHLPNQTSQCDSKEYQQHIYPEFTTTTFLMAFITTTNLNFVIN